MMVARNFVKKSRKGRRRLEKMGRAALMAALAFLTLFSVGGCEKKDSAPLEVELVTTPPKLTANRMAIFRFRCSEPPCSFLCRLNDDVFLACTEDHRITGLIEGKYRFQVYAFGPEGKISPVVDYLWAVTSEVEAYERVRREEQETQEESE